MLLPTERGRARQPDHRVLGAYLAGTTTGALLTTLTAWLLSGLTEPAGPPARVALICAGGAFLWLAKCGPLGRIVSLPEARRQLPAEIFGGSLARGAYRFGFQLGTGMRTYVPSPAPYVLLLALLLARSTLASAILVALGFGLGRALPLMAYVSSPGRERFTRRFLSGSSEFGPHLSTAIVLIGATTLV